MSASIPLRDRLAGLGLYLYSRLIYRTSRYRVRGQEHLEEAWAQGQSVVWATWHGMTMMVSGYVLDLLNQRSDYRMALIVPADWRGNTLSTWARHIGIEPHAVNHHSAALSQARGVVQVLRAMRRGADCYINPDGPDGPPYVVKPGVVFIAQKTGGRLVPIGAFTATKYTLKRWDRYSVPLPFSRIAIVFGEPVPAPRDGDRRAIAQALTTALHQAAADAERLYTERV